MEQPESPLTIPSVGRDKAELLRAMESFREDDADWRDGRTFSLVYHAGDEHLAFLKQAHNLYFSENGLNPMAFKSLRRMELEVVRMTASMLHGGPEVVGTMTTGGTESVLLAVKAYRDMARKERPRVKRPEIVAPETVHVALDKAAHYFGLTIRYAPIGKDYRVDVEAMRRLVNDRTVMLVASAPQYPQGVVDPIEDVGRLAQDVGLPLHVDACIGGFMLPWVERLGYAIPRFDFRVPGVTSVSADVHKYGYAAKGASVLLYRDMRYLRHQFFVSTDWSGGVYASPTMPGTRSGGAVAAAWGAMMAMGVDGYLDHAKRAMDVTRQLRDAIGAIDGVEVLGDPHMTLLACGSTDRRVDVYAVADQLENAGWAADRQQRPASIHTTLTSNHAPVIDQYIEDLQSAVEYVRETPGTKSRGRAAMYGMMAKAPMRGMVKGSVLDVMERMYGKDALRPGADEVSDGGGLVGSVARRFAGPLLGVMDRASALARWLAPGRRRS